VAVTASGARTNLLLLIEAAVPVSPPSARYARDGLAHSGPRGPWPASAAGLL
jgi:hypothetical protein